MSAILRVEGLVKVHGQEPSAQTVLRGVDFELEAGRFACVMGPSGSGKSTLLHLISGLDEPTAGRVELAGRDLARLGAAARTVLRREEVGYVFQFFHLLPNLTVEENVGLPLAIQGRSASEVDAAVAPLLARFGIGARSHAFPHQLSGGEMQRTSIARALAGGQPLLLCDEPTGNLSQKAGLEVMRTLREVCDRDGRSVLLVTHNPRDATFADEVRFLVDGEISTERVLRGPGLAVEAVHEALAALAI
ncbi:MAG TPA: ABC transporter ATP-binding protein [Planctomycetes bacterium]|nr:ABC transporter ATP-binding protein [Planctomycetota bacterium]